MTSAWPRVEGLGFRAEVSGLIYIQGLGLRVEGLAFRFEV